MINPKDVAQAGFRELAPPPGLRVRWTVPTDLPYFAGHFPGNPTLPAVAMIDLTLELVRRWPGFERAELTALKSAKFAAVISPGAELEITVNRDAERRPAWQADWRLDGGNGFGDGVRAASFGFDVQP